MKTWAVTHHAGPLVNGVQRCDRCGYILNDYRNSAVALNADGTTPELGRWIGYVRAEGVVGEERAGYYAAVDTPDAPMCDEVVN